MSPQSDNKQKMLDRIAEESGVAIVVLDERSHEVSVSNNNSICRALTASPEFAPRCAQFCGIAFQKTTAGDDFEYQCHAGLTCKAIAVADRGKQFVAIIGRTFTSADRYRHATERAIAGDWREFPANEFFDNVLMDSSISKIATATNALSRFRVEKSQDVLDLNAPSPKLPEKTHRPKPVVTPAQPAKQPVAKSERAATGAQMAPRLDTSHTETAAVDASVHNPTQIDEFRRKAAEAAAVRSLQDRIAGRDYHSACSIVLDFVWSRHNVGSLVWLENIDNVITPAVSRGAFQDTPIKIGIPADNDRLVRAAEKNEPLQLRERMQGGSTGGRSLYLFPIVVGREIRAALGVEGQIDDKIKSSIIHLCRRVGPQLELLRLKHEVTNGEWLRRATTRFTENLKRIDADDFWTHVTQISAELVQSERASLLVHNPRAEELKAKAAIGSKIDLLTEPEVGSRVARIVLDHGKPVVVPDINQTRIKAAPSEWQYKTNSFISYPILIGDRRLAVINFTDKAGGAVFEDRDIELLDAIVPQLAVAIDRTTLKDMAGEFEQLSVTDALTGLLNRRYLEKRLNEEIQRSKRHRFPMSLMMLDVDNFKSYNDTFGHPAGDTALKMVANVLKDILRGADVAARYGGEEFAILLPQTTSAEAAVIAERLRQRIEHTEFPKRRITISIGIASCSNEVDTPEDVVGAADYALYEAKNHGRNRVQIYDGYGKPLNEKIH